MIQANYIYCALYFYFCYTRLSYEAHDLDPARAQFTGGFAVLGESKAAADLTGGGAQAVIGATGGSGCKEEEASLPGMQLFCCAAQFLTGHNQYQSLARDGHPALSQP